jgi:outer membrane protein assembly factor BamE
MQLILRRLVLLALAALLVAGCVYRPDIQQGNYIEAKTVDQVEAGMTRTQVRYLLGTPMVPDVFDKDRWDYLYYFQRGRWRKPAQRHVVVYFKDDKVVNIDRGNIPAAAPQTPEEGAPVAKFPKI